MMQDIRALYNQMAGREVDEPDSPIETSLDQILAYIRNHWEKVTEKNRAEADSYMECKVRTSHLHRWHHRCLTMCMTSMCVFVCKAGGTVCGQQPEAEGGTCRGTEGGVQRGQL